MDEQAIQERRRRRLGVARVRHRRNGARSWCVGCLCIRGTRQWWRSCLRRAVVVACRCHADAHYIAIAYRDADSGTTHDLNEAAQILRQAARQVEFDDVEANTAADEGA